MAVSCKVLCPDLEVPDNRFTFEVAPRPGELVVLKIGSGLRRFAVIEVQHLAKGVDDEAAVLLLVEPANNA
jgi:hypothetical protein